MDILCELVDAYGVDITAHEGQASDVITVALDESIDSIGIQRHTNVIPEVVAVASWAVTWTVGDIDG